MSKNLKKRAADDDNELEQNQNNTDNLALTSGGQTVRSADSLESKLMPVSSTDLATSQTSPVAAESRKDPLLKSPLAATKLTGSMDSLLIDSPLSASPAKLNLSNNSTLSSSQSLEDISNTEKDKCSYTLNVDNYMSKLDILKDLNIPKDWHIGKKACRKRSSSEILPSDGSSISDESPLKTFRHETGFRMAIPFSLPAIGESTKDIPPIENLNLKDEARSKSVPKKRELQTVESMSSEGTEMKKETAAQNRESDNLDFSNKNVPRAPQHSSGDFHATRIDSLTSLYDRIFDLDRHMSLNPLESVEGPPPEKETLEQMTNSKIVSELLELENDFRRVLKALVDGSEDEDGAAKTFRRSIHEIKDYLRNAARGLNVTSPPKSESEIASENLPVEIEDVRKSLPELWRSARFNNMLLKRWTSCLLDWCLQDNPLALPQQFANCELGINDMRNDIDNVRSRAARLMYRWKSKWMKHSELLDLTLIMAVASNAVSLYNMLENEVLILKFAYLTMSGQRKRDSPGT